MTGFTLLLVQTCSCLLPPDDENLFSSGNIQNFLSSCFPKSLHCYLPCFCVFSFFEQCQARAVNRSCPTFHASWFTEAARSPAEQRLEATAVLCHNRPRCECLPLPVGRGAGAADARQRLGFAWPRSRWIFLL